MVLKLEETMTTPRILLVDDDRLVLATMSEGLRHHGFEVQTASSGEQALAQVESDPPQLAILDIRMPGMSGIETARYLKQDGRVPFMFLSAYGDEEVVREATEEGALGYLVKPVDVAQVVPSLRAALARAKDIAALKTNGTRLQIALNQNRETSMAVGLVMERYRLTREQAFEALRYHARSQRRKLEEVALDLISAAEQLVLPPSVLERAHTPRS
jgi:response regulator NasT